MDSNQCIARTRYSRCQLTVLTKGRHQLRLEAPWKVFGPVKGSGTFFSPEIFENVPAYYLSNSTAGILSGDLLEAEINVAPESGAQIIVPAANKVFSMSGGNAGQNCRFRVGSKAGLFYYGNQLIPYAKANYYQNYEYRLEAGATLVALEFFVPGRLAGGEAFAFSRVKLRSRIFLEERLVLDDRLCLEDSDSSGKRLPGVIGLENQVIGACYIAGPLVEALGNKVNNCGQKAGFTKPCPGLLVGRVLANNVQEAESALVKIFK